MCSINGFTFKNKDLIDKMNQITKHRGPDGTGVYFDENISLKASKSSDFFAAIFINLNKESCLWFLF
jgi:asparagine synthetase B (glutamine-hydrolysing)